MKRILFLIVLFLEMVGCGMRQSLQGTSIVYKVYKQGVLFPTYPTYSVNNELVAVRKEPIAKNLGDDPQWSPVGNWVAFSTSSYSNLLWRNNSSIFIFNVDRFERYVVTDEGNYYNPTWDPKGTKIAYDSRNKIWISDVRCFIEGKKNCKLAPMVLVDGSNPDWSPDGERIVFETNDHHIAIITLDDSKRQIIDLTPGIQAFMPDWSPDGKRIVFSSYNKERETMDIYLLDFTEGQIVNLTNGVGSNTAPKWTKDGNRIVFISTHRDELGRIIGIEDTVRSNALYSMNPEGLDLKRIGSHEDEMVVWYSILP
jgi:Tol biopolymer transport system component